MTPSGTTTGARRHDRVRTRLVVRYGIESADREDVAESISEGGLYIATNDIYKVGTRLIVEIEFPQRTIRLCGEVVWAIGVPEHLRDSMVCGIGVRFVAPDPEWPVFFREWKRHVDS